MKHGRWAHHIAVLYEYEFCMNFCPTAREGTVLWLIKQLNWIVKEIRFWRHSICSGRFCSTHGLFACFFLAHSRTEVHLKRLKFTGCMMRNLKCFFYNHILYVFIILRNFIHGNRSFISYKCLQISMEARFCLRIISFFKRYHNVKISQRDNILHMQLYFNCNFMSHNATSFLMLSFLTFSFFYSFLWGRKLLLGVSLLNVLTKLTRALTHLNSLFRFEQIFPPENKKQSQRFSVGIFELDWGH